MRNYFPPILLLTFLFFSNFKSRAQISYTAKVEVGHVFNDLHWGGKKPKFAENSNTWEARSFLFSPLIGIYGQLNYKSAFLSIACQFQKNGRYFSEAVRNITGYPEVQTSRFSQWFVLNKFCFPLSIGLKNKKKKKSEGIFIGIRPCVYTKANFKSVSTVEKIGTTIVDSTFTNMLSNGSQGRTIPKSDLQGFLGFNFPENGPVSVSFVVYMGNIYKFDKLHYQFHAYQTKYVNFDGVLSVKYCFNSK